MNIELDTHQRKALANSPKRDEALAVLMPRILGAAYTAGHVMPYMGRRSTIVVARREPFQVVVALDSPTVLFEVEWKGNQVIRGHLHSDRGGTYLDKRVRITKWHRGTWWRRGAWQTALFDSFHADSYDLLTTPNVPSEVTGANSRARRCSMTGRVTAEWRKTWAPAAHTEAHQAFLPGNLPRLPGLGS